MSAHRASPLRDRLLSNSPDPIKSSILRESGLGWGTSSPPSSSAVVTPLRIAKRDSPQRHIGSDIPRRTSSSYKHVRNNNLVSKSPFKSQIPTPTATPLAFPGSPRRVSGEKRTRPVSMTEQAENERPFAFKRERRQSKGFQGLMQKEPVSKSPFKRISSSEESALPGLPPKPASPSSRKPIPAFTAPEPEPFPSQRADSSPPRSSLVSRRMHGPRSNGDGSLNGRRRRRNRVTFNERCDVYEFDRDEEEEAIFSEEDDYGQDDDDDDFFLHPGPSGPDDSYENIPLDADDSITGIVDAMLNPSTPPPDFDPDPSPRSAKPNYAEHHPSPKSTPPTTSFPLHTSVPPALAFALPTHAEAHPPATPPRPPRGSMSPAQVPLGRSTHIERARAARMGESTDVEQNSERDVEMLPESPSPSKKSTPIVSSVSRSAGEGVPKFGIEVPRGRDGDSLGGMGDDPFLMPRLRDERFPLIEGEQVSVSNASIDPANLSIGNSEVSIDGLLAMDFEKKVPLKDVEMLLGEFGMEHVMGLGMGVIGVEERPESEESSFSSSFMSERSVLEPVVPTGGNGGVSGENIEKSESGTRSPINQVGSPGLGLGEPLRVASPHVVSPLVQGGSPAGSAFGSPLPNSSSASPVMESSSVNASPLVKGSSASPLVKSFSASPLVTSSSASPLTQTLSGSSLASSGSITGRQRIRREDVQKRLTKRSAEGVEDAQVEMGGEESKEGEQRERESREKKTESILSDSTDHSAELATIETAKMMNLGVRPQIPDTRSHELGMSLDFDFGSKFGRGLGMGMGGGSGRVEVSQMDVDMDMRSALDRLMDDVAGSSAVPSTPAERAKEHQTPEGEDSMVTNEGDDSVLTALDEDVRGPPGGYGNVPMQRAATDSVILPGLDFVCAPLGRSASGSTIPPPPPPKDAIRSREEMILGRRREVRRREEEVDMGYSTPPRSTGGGGGRPSRRRSMSTGDAEEMGGAKKKRGRVMRGDGGLLEDVVPLEGEEDPLGDSIDRELRKLEAPVGKNKYQVREHAGMIYASSDADRISHMNSAGDVNGGKAWRTVRRPSDMNEYSKQIKEFRALEKPGKAHGKVFVKVLGMKNMNLPMPQQATVVTCTLNNGIHFVTTPECRLGRDFRIDQEFELIEHSKLEFTLTLKVRRDPHIIAQFKALAPAQPPPPPPPPVVAPAPSSKGGMRSFFSSSPKKSKEKPVPQARPPPPQPQPQAPLPENLARYLKLDGTLARAFISFKDIAHRCDSRLFETTYPLIGQKSEAGNTGKALQVGEIVLQMFRLPPLPGISPEQLPQSLEECHRGLRHINWHKVTYFEGTLTQNGGDCSSWRRRQLRVIGSNLVAFNDVTKKATVTIDLKKALAVEDDQANLHNPASPKTRSRYADEYDGLYGVERSFRLVFPHDQEIVFFADTDEEKAKWLEVLCALVGHIPPHPLWAEFLWQRQEELTKRAQQAAGPSRGSRPTSKPGTPRTEQR